MGNDNLKDMHTADTVDITLPKDFETSERRGVRVDRPFETRRAVRSELSQAAIEEEDASLEGKILTAINHFNEILKLIDRTPTFRNRSSMHINETYRQMLGLLKSAVDRGSHKSMLKLITDRVLPVLGNLVLTFESHERIGGHFSKSLEKFKKLEEDLDTKIALG